MISAENTGLMYADGTQAIKPFNLEIGQGEMVYIIGPSGSGKTSLLKLMMGMEYPTSGVFKVLDTIIASENRNEIQRIRRQMGPVFQEFRLLEGRSVLENVMLGMRFLDIPHSEIKIRAEKNIEKVGLGHKMKHAVDQLSWGECQRVSIARAVSRNPRLIVADEPTGNLDQDNALNILALLKSFVDDETTVIVTTHATHLIDPFHKGILIQMDAGKMRLERRG